MTVGDLSILGSKAQQAIRPNLASGEQVLFCVKKSGFLGDNAGVFVVTKTRILHVYGLGGYHVSIFDFQDITSIEVRPLSDGFQTALNSIGRPSVYLSLPTAQHEEFKPYLDRLRTMIQRTKSGQGVLEDVVTPSTSVSELERLAALHKNGHLTDEEFRAAKAKLLGL